jgi:hypothetical protein
MYPSQLFIQHQIPSDLLSYDGDLPAVGHADLKLEAVKR